MADEVSKDDEPTARAQIGPAALAPTYGAPEVQPVQDRLRGPTAGHGVPSDGWGTVMVRPRIPPPALPSVILARSEAADSEAVVPCGNVAVPQQALHGQGRLVAATGGQLQRSMPDTEVQQQSRLRGAGFANAARSMGLQIGRQPRPSKQQAGAVGPTGTSSDRDVMRQYNDELLKGLTQEEMMGLAKEEKRGRHRALMLLRQQQAREADTTTRAPDGTGIREAPFLPPQYIAASTGQTQALPPAPVHYAGPHPPAMFTPPGTFLWSWARNEYIFCEGTTSGISQKVICEGYLRGYHGAWVEPDPKYIARRGWPIELVPSMMFFPDGFGEEVVRAAMFGCEYPRYLQPRNKVERDRKMRQRAIKKARKYANALAMAQVQAQATQSPKEHYMGVLKPRAPKRMTMSGLPLERGHIEDDVSRHTKVARHESLINVNNLTRPNGVIRPTSSSTNVASRDHPRDKVKNPYEYPVDPSTVLIQPFPADAPNALDTKFDYEPAPPLMLALNGETFVRSEYVAWPPAALKMTVKATGEVLLLTSCEDGRLMAEDQRLREDVEMKKKT